MASITIKRGDTFGRTCTYTVDGVASSIATISIRSQLRRKDGTLVFELVVVKLADSGDTLGKFTIGAPKEVTVLWEPGAYLFDIEYTQADGSRDSTETVTLRVIEDITR